MSTFAYLHLWILQREKKLDTTMVSKIYHGENRYIFGSGACIAVQVIPVQGKENWAQVLQGRFLFAI